MSFDAISSEPTGQTVQVVGFGRRFVAYFIDVIILSVIGGCLGSGIGLVSAGNEEVAAVASLFAQCLGILIAVAYYVAFWATSGQTIGKMALGIKVISTDGSAVSWGKALVRYVGYMISGLALALGFIWVAFDAKRQGWHDKIAGTYVVYVAPKDTDFPSADAVALAPSDTGISAVVAVALTLFLCLVPVVVIAILLLLGPVIGNVYQNIIMNLEAPVP